MTVAVASAVRRVEVRAEAVSVGARLVSLDVFRGLTMAAMVIVNNPGDWGAVYWPLDHAAWNGWTPTDLIFPFFVFIVGVSITLSRKSASWGSILRRGALIIAIGWFLALYPRFDIHRFRIPGVLPRIGVCYILAAALFKLTARAGRRRQGVLMVVTALLLCAGYWFVMTQVPNPVGVRGDLTPEGNWGAYIDRALFGAHLWVTSKTWDPEGLLSTVPAVASAVLGIAGGLWLGSDISPQRKVINLAAAGVAAIAIGYAWNPFFPINKNLWTSSYVFFTAGMAAVLLALLHAAIDSGDPPRPRSWPVRMSVILGTNAITLFAVSALLVKTMNLIKITQADGQVVAISRWLYTHAFAPFAPPKIASLGYAIANLVVLFTLLAWMHRRRLFLRV